MGLTVGSRAAQYEITSLLGEGGMGRVFQARDTRLERNVAIKVLPEAVATDPDRVARFEREAKVLASLNHPNIASLFGLEQEGGELLLVMELVDGETIADRLQRGPIPVAETLAIVSEIAAALEAAHESGVVHRDLKPANVKLDREGRVKVLDFGLAKAMEPAATGANVTHSPTLSLGATQAGVILGTAAYMSPEQAKGGVVDRRSDVFSLGCVIFEMLAGRQAFPGETAAEILASVLIREPEYGLLPDDLDPRIGAVLRRCLEKNPKRRWQAVGDLRLELEAIAGGAPAPAAVAQGTVSAPFWRRAAPIAMTAVVVATAAAAVTWMLKPADPPAVAQFSIEAPEGTVFVADGRLVTGGVISPDGRTVVFTARNKAGETMIWSRRIDELAAQPLAGTEGALFPFWSPDSRFIGFFAQNKLKKIGERGGPAQTLCDATSGRGGAWNRDGTILFTATSAARGITGVDHFFRVSSAGGVATALEARIEGEGSRRFPAFLPDGRRFLFFSNGGDAVYAASMDSSETTRLLTGVESGAVWSPSGHLLFVVDSTLYARPFDPDRLEFRGEPFPIAQNVAGAFQGHVTFSVADSGALTYGVGARRTAPQQLVWVDRQGASVQAVGQAGFFKGVDLSSDQKQVAYHRDETGSGGDMWVLDVTRGTSSRLTSGGAQQHNGPGVWLPGSQQIVFTSRRSGKWVLVQKAASGLGAETLLLESDLRVNPFGASPDARLLLFQQRDPTGEDIWMVPLSGDRKPVPLLNASANEIHPQVSPNGKWIAYASSETGTRQVYVRSFPAGPEKLTVSTGQGGFPRWRADGRELFYVEAPIGGAGAMMAVDVREAGTTLALGQPKQLFDNSYVDVGPDAGGNYHIYAVSPDGQRFLIPRAPTAAGTTDAVPSQPIVVVLNWAATIVKP